MKKVWLIGTAMVMAAAAMPASAQNVVQNGSFENGFANWTLGGDIAANGASGSGQSDPVILTYGVAAPYPGGAYGEAIATDNAVSASPDAVGTKVLYLSQDFGTQTLSQSVTLAANQQYRIGFDYYVPQNGYDNRYDATLSFSRGSTVLTSLTVGSAASGVLPTTWYNFSQTFNSGAGGTGQLTFAFGGTAYPAADFGIDRVYLVAVPEATTWAMMIAGFGLVGGAMRRRAVRHAIA